MKGEVVGITSAKITSVGVEGLGYAISINKAIPIIEKLITNG
jgi:serine protease Do